jgi:hypothetical protein
MLDHEIDCRVIDFKEFEGEAENPCPGMTHGMENYTCPLTLSSMIRKLREPWKKDHASERTPE